MNKYFSILLMMICLFPLASASAEEWIIVSKPEVQAALIQGASAIIVGVLTLLGGLSLVFAAQISASSQFKVKESELKHKKHEDDTIADREYATYLSICHTEAWTRRITYENIAEDISAFIEKNQLPPSSFVENTAIQLFIIGDSDRKFFGRIPKAAFDNMTKTTEIRSKHNYRIFKAVHCIKTTEDILRNNSGNSINDDYHLKVFNHHKSIALCLLTETIPALKQYATFMSDIVQIIEQELNKVKKNPKQLDVSNPISK